MMVIMISSSNKSYEKIDIKRFLENYFYVSIVCVRSPWIRLFTPSTRCSNRHTCTTAVKWGKKVSSIDLYSFKMTTNFKE
jgi:hypothetical protein